MRRLTLLTLLTLCPSILRAQSTLVIGTVTDTGGQAWINGTYTFKSQALGQSAISGNLDATGSYSVSIPHTPATSLVGDVWQLSVCPAFTYGCFNSNPITIVQQTQTLNITPTDININVPTIPQQVTPVQAYADDEITGGWPGFTYYNVTSAVSRQCTAITAGNCTTWGAYSSTGGNNTFSGTQTFTGLVQCKNMEHEACVDTANSQSWAGTDFCAWIISAQASLASTGGVVHGYLNGTTVTCAGTFNVGTAAQGVKLFLDAGEIDVQNLINVAQGSRLQGLNGGSGNAGTTPTVIKAGASFPTSGVYLIQMGPSSGTADGTSLQDIQLNLNNVALSKAINVSSVQDIGDITNVFILNNVGNAVDITGSAQNITFTNVVNIASSAVTADNCYTIPATADHVTFINTGCTSTAASTSTGAAFQCNGCNIGIYSSHVEKHTDGVLLNSSGVNAGAVVISEMDGLGNMTNMVHISSTWAGSLSASGIRKFLGTNSVKNDIAAFNHVCTDESLASYILAASATTTQLQTTCSTLASRYRPGFYVGDIDASAASSDLMKLNFDPVTYDGFVASNHGSATRKWAFGPGTGGAGWGLRQQTPNTQTAFVCQDASPFNCAFQVPITPNAAGAVDIGSTSLPWGNLWLGTAATNNFKLAPVSTTGARTWNIPDWGANNAAQGATQNQPYVLILTSQYTNSTTTFTNVAGGATFQFPVLANVNYTATCHLYYQAAATGGLNIEFTGPASPTNVIYGLDDPSGATTFNSSVATAYSTSLGQAITTAATNFDASVSFSLINGANAGTVNMLAKSSAAAQLQIQAGSYCQIQ